MYSIADLIERAKSNSNIESDYRLSKIIGINQSAFGNYKAGRSWPTDKILSQLCALSGDDVAVVAAQVQAERSQSEEGRGMWLMIAKRLQGAATTAILSVCFAISLIALPATDARAATVEAYRDGGVNLLYIVSTTFLTVGDFLAVRLRRFAGLWRLSLGIIAAG